MITEAIVKLTTESNTIATRTAQRAAEYLIDTITEDSAAKIMQADKSLSAAITICKTKSKPQKEGDCAMVTDEEVYGWLNEYYGMRQPGGGHQAAAKAPAPDQLSIKLTDLL